MSGKQFIVEEATGVYVGTLVEDMIETVKREKKLYCNVHIPQFFAEDYGYPLTFVPLWAMSLPLKKGDKVMVKFNQDNLMYPVLYKNPNEIDSQFFEKFDFGNFVSGGNVTKPQSADTVGATSFGENSYAIKTDDYTVFHQNNGFILIDKNDKVYVYGSEINIVSTGKVNIDATQDVSVYTNGACNIVSKTGCTINNHLKVNP